MDKINSRRHYRLSIRMAVRVEGQLGSREPFSEDTHTLNVSLEGLLFRSRQDLAVGQIVTVSVGDKCRLQARIAWRGDKDRDGWREVGAQLLPPIVDWVIR